MAASTRLSGASARKRARARSGRDVCSTKRRSQFCATGQARRVTARNGTTKTRYYVTHISTEGAHVWCTRRHCSLLAAQLCGFADRRAAATGRAVMGHRPGNALIVGKPRRSSRRRRNTSGNGLPACGSVGDEQREIAQSRQRAWDGVAEGSAKGRHGEKEEFRRATSRSHRAGGSVRNAADHRARRTAIPQRPRGARRAGGVRRTRIEWTTDEACRRDRVRQQIVRQSRRATLTSRQRSRASRRR